MTQQQEPQQGQAFHSGFVALIGRPNAGKSSLINRLLGQKVAIVSPKPQTTRQMIRGIYTDARLQVVFMDTPGVHKPKYKLGERMMASVEEALAGCDVVCYLVDASQPFGAGEAYILSLLQQVKLPVFLILNKVDTLRREQLLPLIDFYSHQYPFREIVPLSALTGENSEQLLPLLWQYLPEGPQYYPAEMHSDYPDTLLAAELIREQALRLTEQEVPHSLAAVVNALEERPNGLLYIEAYLYVERESQKAIVIGKGGAMLKQIGAAARAELEKAFRCRVYLDLRVKSRKDWRDNDGILDHILS